MTTCLWRMATTCLSISLPTSDWWLPAGISPLFRGIPCAHRDTRAREDWITACMYFDVDKGKEAIKVSKATNISSSATNRRKPMGPGKPTGKKGPRVTQARAIPTRQTRCPGADPSTTRRARSRRSSNAEEEKRPAGDADQTALHRDTDGSLHPGSHRWQFERENA